MQPAKRFGRMLCNAVTLPLRKENRKKINLDIPEELLGLIFAQLPLIASPKTFLVSKEWKKIATDSFHLLLGKHFLLPGKKECIPNNYWQFQKNFLYIPVYSVSTKNFRKEIRHASKKINYFSGNLLKQRIDLILNWLKYIINDEDSGTYLFNFHMQVTCRVDFYESHLSDMLTTLLQCYTALKPNYPKLNVSFCLKMTDETLFINSSGIKLGDPLSEEFDYEASTYFNFFENILEKIN